MYKHYFYPFSQLFSLVSQGTCWCTHCPLSLASEGAFYVPQIKTKEKLLCSFSPLFKIAFSLIYKLYYLDNYFKKLMSESWEKWIHLYNEFQVYIYTNALKILCCSMGKWSEVAQLCPTLCNPMDCSLPGASVHWGFSGKSTGVGCHFLLQRIFPTQGSNLGLPQYRQKLYRLSHIALFK